MWGEADTIKDGPCDWGAGVGGGPTDGATCSYRAENFSQTSAPSWALFVTAMGLLAFRKRGQRGAK